MPKVKQAGLGTEPTQPEPPPFNLWTEPWITLERSTGGTEQHGIEYTLLNAHEFRSIYDPSPLVVVGIQRLLIAILQDAINPQSEDDLSALWDAGCFPPDSIHQFGERYADRFDLFSPDRPFLQSSDLPLRPAKNDKPICVSKLFLEIPEGESEVTLYNRTTDDEQVFSPATVAAGLVTIPPFVSRQGRGYFASINGVPPIYVLPGGKSLFEILLAALLTPMFYPQAASRKRDDVWWRREALVERNKELVDIGYLHSLTFPARRIRLHPQRVDTVCTRSGRYTEWGVRTIVFEMGEHRPKDAPWWQDPFAAYRLPVEKQSSRPAKDAAPKKKDAPTPIRPQQGKAAWREFGGLFMNSHNEKPRTKRPLFIEQMVAFDLLADQATYAFQCVGVLTDNAKTFEWMEFGFDVPPSVLADARTGSLVDRALVFVTDCGSIIASVYAQHFGGSSRKAERHLTLKNRMVDSYWHALAGDFRRFVLSLGNVEAQTAAFEGWINTVVTTARAVFSDAAEAAGDDAINLRLRTEGEQHCAVLLYARKNKEIPNG